MIVWSQLTLDSHTSDGITPSDNASRTEGKTATPCRLPDRVLSQDNVMDDATSFSILVKI